ncbi:hypothetical protein [Subtercola sp. RTI3]|uniref:hypothetical protein n=1 Tax=Subtercola sp. RTI3 TaxID=3048639 RepID=UPI002B22DF5D|nr:hypothetical protein [Subtercola sp. RTI3]MEA9986269.1 hypothetical protein [Subtercola sp. RTI3]
MVKKLWEFLLVMVVAVVAITVIGQALAQYYAQIAIAVSILVVTLIAWMVYRIATKSNRYR